MAVESPLSPKSGEAVVFPRTLRYRVRDIAPLPVTHALHPSPEFHATALIAREAEAFWMLRAEKRAAYEGQKAVLEEWAGGRPAPAQGRYAGWTAEDFRSVLHLLEDREAANDGWEKPLADARPPSRVLSLAADVWRRLSSRIAPDGGGSPH